MNKKFLYAALMVGLLAVFGRPVFTDAATGLQVTYGSKGIQQLSYNGTVLEDLGQYPADQFHIWHMQATDLNGNLITTADGWGEVNNGEVWNPNTDTWTYTFAWGTISTQFIQSGNTLSMNVVEKNNAGSGIIFDGADIYPFELHFPELPVGFVDPAYEKLEFNTEEPSAIVADWGNGEVTAVNPDVTTPLYSGFWPQGSNNYTPIIASTPIDGQATFFPVFNRPVQPGQSDSFSVQLRFGSSGVPATTVGSDVYAAWAKQYPSELNWPDRRIIGSAYLASSPQGNVNYPGGTAANPQRYFYNNNGGGFDIRTPNGLATFQSLILQQAESDVANAKQMNAQGIVTWDIEGEAYPQDTSYACSPDEIAQLSPEMESIVSDPTSPYHGMKLDDAYFKIIRDAGLRVGVCVRPQQFVLHSNGTAEQDTLPNNQIAPLLISKMEYAHNRWGATMFYVDSNVDVNGGTLPASIFKQVAEALPDSLIMPEHSDALYYAYTAPLLSFIFHQDLGTPTSVYALYPKAFSTNLVNDADPTILAQDEPQLTQSVKDGDVLVMHADYWQANNPTAVQIYENAGVATGSTTVPTVPIVTPTPTSTPVTTTPASTKFSINQNVMTTAALNVRQTPSLSGTLIDTAPSDAVGTVVGGPVLADGYNWWNVNYLTGGDGWSIEDYLTSASAPSPIYASNEFSDNENVVTTAALNVRQNPSIISPLINTQSSGNSGTIIGGPVTANGYNWWSVRYADGSAGWSIQDYLEPAPVFTPIITPTQNPPSTSNPITVPTSTTPVTTPVSTATTPTIAVAIVDPTVGQTVSGVITVNAAINVGVDSAGSYLMVDGQEVGTSRVTSPPFTYRLDTTDLSNGQHTLTVWVHDINNDALLSAPVTVMVSNATVTTTPTTTPTSTPPSTIPVATTSTLIPTTPALPSMPSVTISLPVVITSPSAGTIVSNTIAVTAAINAGVDSAGSYLMVDGQEVGNLRITGLPYIYLLDTTKLSNGQHTLIVWAHDINNDVLLSSPVVITVNNALGASASSTPVYSAPPGTSSAITITYPASGQTISKTISVTASITAGIDSAGTYLMVDGQEVGTNRVTNGPFSYVLDTTKLSNGTHMLSIWAHDINNDVLISAPLTITVAN
jgi:hypothetical protein